MEALLSNEISLKPLFYLKLRVGAHHNMGVTPRGYRRVAPVSGGRFEGRVSGEVLPGGTDWITLNDDQSCMQIDVRLPLKTDEGSLVILHYAGIRAGDPEILARVSSGEAVDPESYYYYVTGSFEASEPNLSWLNRLVCIGKGSRRSTGPEYAFFEVA
ncbi:MAG: hypothetical protein B7X99_17080 [Rhizobiales bacterium 17-65-6]|nr:MAG: hypothetical protein B7Z30_00185 [Rhizobiales bacterium 12-68-15]OYX90561.1 MAG: hypothetical protein B7Y84_00415 [Azorhizobium sp. 32-67-21]OYZ90402.1 MAG: hypothetical protein B7X99_17080 [Rhizobiales bacterium 17-65-6]